MGSCALRALSRRVVRTVQEIVAWIYRSETLIAHDLHRATEMDITMIGLQNAGKTSLLRVLAVSNSYTSSPRIQTDCACDRAESLPSSRSSGSNFDTKH